LKLSADGEIQWQYTYGKGQTDIAYNIAQTEDGGYVVSGFTESSGLGNADIWIMKLLEDGSVDWQRTYGGTQIDRARAMDLTSDGGCVIAGETDSYGAGGIDIWVMKLGADGKIDPSCGFIHQSNVTAEPGANALENNSTATTASPSITSGNSSVSIQPTSGQTFLLCEAPQFSLTITAATGGSTQPVPGHYRCYKGTRKQITAIPDSNYSFSHWSGDIPPSAVNDNPITLYMDRDRTITPLFDPLLFPPLEFSASRVLNRSLSQAEYINMLTWNPNPANSNIATYRIYVEQGGTQNILAELPVPVSEYRHRNIDKNQTYVYSITAVDEDGLESPPSTISTNQTTRHTKKKKTVFRPKKFL
jgi:hypothetical protein